jgi:hypothetical protein
MKQPIRQRRAWDKFITDSRKRPQYSQWSDMSLAPVETFVLAYCEDSFLSGYQEYAGLCLAVCLKIKIEGKRKHEYTWLRADNTLSDPKTFKPCNPMWWQRLPMHPPKREE